MPQAIMSHRVEEEGVESMNFFAPSLSLVAREVFQSLSISSRCNVPSPSSMARVGKTRRESSQVSARAWGCYAPPVGSSATTTGSGSRVV